MSSPRGPQAGDIALAFSRLATCLRRSYVRCWLALSEPDDVVVAFISSQLPVRGAVGKVVLTPGDAEFGETGLARPSVVRLDKLVTIQRMLLQPRLGGIGQKTRVAVDDALRAVFAL